MWGFLEISLKPSPDRFLGGYHAAIYESLGFHARFIRTGMERRGGTSAWYYLDFGITPYGNGR